MRPQGRRRGVDGATAQVICLVVRGSAWLARPEGAPPELQGADSPSFRDSASLRFGAPGGPCDGTAPWLASLRERGVDRLYLDLPGALRPAQAGLGARLVAGRGGAPVDAWLLRQTHVEAADGRIWRSEYRRVKPPAGVVAPDLGGAAAGLRATLADLVSYCAGRGWDPWRATFEQALAAGSAEDPVPPWYADMADRDAMTLDARRVLAMAAGTNVFHGGMGSWLDLPPEARAEGRDEDPTARGRQAARVGLLAGANAPLRR